MTAAKIREMAEQHGKDSVMFALLEIAAQLADLKESADVHAEKNNQRMIEIREHIADYFATLAPAGEVR